MICILNSENKIVNIVDANVCSNENEAFYYPWCKLGEQYTDIEPLEYARKRFLTEAGSIFAQKRDRLRFITLGSETYGFDCANDDITNFLVVKDALKDDIESWDGKGIEPTAFYKVWLTETTKGGVMLSMDNFKTVQKIVRESQLQDYAWYNEKKLQIEMATSKEELDAIVLTD